MARSALPETISEHLPPERLDDNYHNYQRLVGLNLGEQAAVAMVRERLLAIPLTHATQSSASSLLQKGIMPASHPDNPARRNNAYTLDRSLGLDDFVFMHWGGVARSASPYGKTIACLDPKQLLKSPHTVVTSEDITATIFFGRRKPYDKLKPRAQRKVQEYFDQAMTGSDWIDIIAARALHYMQTTRRPAYNLNHHDDLGEIKYGGIITPDMITDVIDTNSASIHAQKHMLTNGFSPVSKKSLPAHESIATWNAILEEANRHQN